MSGRTTQTGMMELEIGRIADALSVRIPRMESESDYLLLEERLQTEFSRQPAIRWVFDLSEHQEGVTLVLAGVLAGLGEEAKRSGCTVEYTGIKTFSEQEDGGRGRLSGYAERAGRRAIWKFPRNRPLSMENGGAPVFV